MICIVQAGRPKAGKTTYTKNKLLAEHKGPKLIYDVNNEYGVGITSMDDFLERVLKCEKTLVVFEEATIFFSTSGQNVKIKEMLVRMRHTNNLFVFNFHGLAQIPNYILTFCTFLNIFHTNDQWPQVERKFKNDARIYKAFEQVNKSSIPWAHKLIEM